MNNQRPLILISNDDSINAPGILRLAECVPDYCDVIVVGPDAPHSGQSSAITVGTPLRITPRGSHGNAQLYAVNGSPVDCVKLALSKLVDRRPTLVLAGINHGSNSACNVVYSGTMGAVLEGATVGITSCGFSITDHAMDVDFTPTMPFVRSIIEHLLANPLPSGICLNVNMPAGITPKGVRTCRAARAAWTDEYADYADPFGRPFYWLTGRMVNHDANASDTDEYWLNQGFITVVPVNVDMTAHNLISQFSKDFDR